MDSAGGVICEPNDAPLDSRHLDMLYALMTLTDKIYMGNVVSRRQRARHDRDERDPVRRAARRSSGRRRRISLINCNSPLRWDDRMLDAMWEYNLANQPVVMTPFLLMGAMSPVTIPATLVQQMAEALTGIALTQLVRPGCPVIFGSFLSNIDMQSGSPQFGTPESGLGLLCTGQIARHFGLPWRSGGGLNSSQMPDAQAAYESLMTMLPTFLAGANWVMHSAGWLDGGLVSCYEKFVIDVEILRMLQAEFTPLEVDEASLAFGAHTEVGAGGHFLGAAHTLERFRTCFYRPLLSSSENFDRWTKNGSKDAAARAHDIWPQDAGRVRAAADRRVGARRARGVRHPPPQGARRLTRPSPATRARPIESSLDGPLPGVSATVDRPRGGGGGRLAEDDGAVAVEQDPGLGVPLDRAGQRLALDVAADGDELVGVQRVVDPGHLLLDDRALVQVGRHVVRGGADQLDPARVRLVVRPRPLERGRNEWWMLMARPSSALHRSSDSTCM